MKNKKIFYAFIILFLFIISINNGYCQKALFEVTCNCEWKDSSPGDEALIYINFSNFDQPNVTYLFKATLFSLLYDKSGNFKKGYITSNDDFFNRMSYNHLLSPAIYIYKVDTEERGFMILTATLNVNLADLAYDMIQFEKNDKGGRELK